MCLSVCCSNRGKRLLDKCTFSEQSFVGLRGRRVQKFHGREKRHRRFVLVNAERIKLAHDLLIILKKLAKVVFDLGLRLPRPLNGLQKQHHQCDQLVSLLKKHRERLERDVSLVGLLLNAVEFLIVGNGDSVLATAINLLG